MTILITHEVTSLADGRVVPQTVTCHMVGDKEQYEHDFIRISLHTPVGDHEQPLYDFVSWLESDKDYVRALFPDTFASCWAAVATHFGIESDL